MRTISEANLKTKTVIYSHEEEMERDIERMESEGWTAFGRSGLKVEWSYSNRSETPEGKPNLRCLFTSDLNFMTGNCSKGHEYVLTRDDAKYFAAYLQVIEDTDEEAENFLSGASSFSKIGKGGEGRKRLFSGSSLAEMTDPGKGSGPNA